MKVRPRNTYGLSLETLAMLITIRDRQFSAEMRVLQSQLVAALGVKPEEGSIPETPHVTTTLDLAKAYRIAKRLKRNDYRRPLVTTIGDIREIVRNDFAKRQQESAPSSGTIDRTQRAFDRRYAANAMRMLRKQYGLHQRKSTYASTYQVYWNWISAALTLAAEYNCTVPAFLQRSDALQLILRKQYTRSAFVRWIQKCFDDMVRQMKHVSSLMGEIIALSVPEGVTKRELRQLKRESREQIERQMAQSFKPIIEKRVEIIHTVVATLYGEAV